MNLRINSIIILLCDRPMNSIVAKEEAQKDFEEETARNILDDSMKLQSMSPQMALEIAVAFKIPEGQSIDHFQLLKKLRNRLASIICEEKEDSINYLQLKRFQVLPPPTLQLLIEIITECWEEFQRCTASKDGYEKYSKYLCRSQNPKEVMDFHLRMFENVKSYLYYPYGQQYPPQNYPMMGLGPPKPQNMPPPPQNPDSYPLYSQMGMQGMNSVPGISSFQNLSGYQNINQPNPYYSSSYPQIKKQEGVVASQAIHQDTFSQQKIPKQEPPQKKTYKKSSEDGPFSTHRGRADREVPQVTNKPFWNCACRGRVAAEEKHFECADCEKKFHLTCLLIPSYASEKIGVKKVCPQCSLRNNNAFYEVIGDPLETFWSDDKELHKRKITIKGKRCKEIIEKKHSLQLRFLKVEGRTLFQWDDNPSIKEESAIKEESGFGNNRPKKNFLNQILIGEDMLNRGNGDDVKISLDCMRPQKIEEMQNRKTTMIFVAIYVVKKKTYQQILSGPYEDFEDDYMNRFFKETTNEIKIEIFDTTPKLIVTPVRGIDCDHPDVLCLEQFVNHCLGLNADSCFTCAKKCRTFKIDRLVQREINKIREQFPDERNCPGVIYYQRDGTFRWEAPLAVENSNMDQGEQDSNQIPEFEFDINEDIPMVSEDQINDEGMMMQDEDSEDEKDASKSRKISSSKKIRKEPKSSNNDH